MKLKVLLFIVTFSILAHAQEIKHASSYDAGIKQAVKENKQLTLFVYSDYCPWCKKMERTTLKDKEVVKYVNDNFILVVVNQDNDIFPERFLPNGIPTTYVIDAKKQEKLYTMKGYKKKSSFLGRLKI